MLPSCTKLTFHLFGVALYVILEMLKPVTCIELVPVKNMHHFYVLQSNDISKQPLLSNFVHQSAADMFVQPLEMGEFKVEARGFVHLQLSISICMHGTAPYCLGRLECQELQKCCSSLGRTVPLKFGC